MTTLHQDTVHHAHAHHTPGRPAPEAVSKARLRPVWLNLLLVGLALIAGAATYFYAPDEMMESQRRMATIFAMAMALWVTEAIPLFATSLLVIMGESWFIAVPEDLQVDISYQLIFSAMSNPVIFIFLGGFILAAAVQREKIDVQMAALMLRPFGRGPAGVMAGIILITALFSMFMSNTATTAMMIILVQPLLAQVPERDRFRKGLILAVPFAANIGGIGTPIGTPPNAIALAQLQQRGLAITFAEWMICAVPLLLGALAVLWITLLALFRPEKKHLHVDVPRGFRLSFHAFMVYATFAATVALWLTSTVHGIPTAVVAVLPAAALTASGVIGRREFNRLDWDILVLIAGGIALGTGFAETGLDQWVVRLMPTEGLEFHALAAAACLVTVGLSTVISHTVATNLLLPIVLAVAGSSAGSIELQTLAIMVAVTSSFAMGLPISTPPNAIAYSTGQVSTQDIMKMGGVISLVAAAFIILTGPYLLEWVLGRLGG